MERKTCGYCGRRIWFWQEYKMHDLKANSIRVAMKNVKFHAECLDKMPKDAM